MNKTLTTIGVVLALAVVALLLMQFSQKTEGPGEDTPRALAATVYKAPLCGCCVGYSGALEEQGFDVEIVSTEDMSSVKEKYDIPPEMESCHTTVIGNYFIEGHVPFEVVEKLLSEKPEIDGIALPDMHAGTPGMPGVKQDLYTIYQLTDGEYSTYTTI